MRTATNVSKTAPASRSKLPAKAKRPVKAAEPSETTAPKGTVPLKKLCAEIGINPKIARRELRKIRREAIAGKESNALRKHDLHTRWFLSGEQLAEARKVLKDYVDRNGETE